MVTESWCKVNQLSEDINKKNLVTPPSSSDSNFTDPQCFLKEDDKEDDFSLDVEVPNSTQHETFLHNLTLNSFKLNEYNLK